MILARFPKIQSLSPADKFALLSELWDDLAANSASIPVDEEQIAELDRRMEDYRNDPTQVTTWTQIKARLLDPKN